MRLNNAKEHAALENDKKVKERQSMEQYFASSLQEKDGEIDRQGGICYYVLPCMRSELHDRVVPSSRLRSLLDDRSKSTVAEIEEVQRQIVEVSREAEAHKTKRLTARNEMINLVQALEKAQAEADEMQSFFHMKLVPMAYEQVSGIENALMSLETAVGMLSSKKMVKFHSRANEFLQKRLKAHNSRGIKSGGGSEHLSVSDDGTRGETESVGSREELVSSSFSDTKHLSSRNSNTGFAKHVLGGGKPAHIAGIGDTMELAHNLHTELDRMRSGIQLLAQSLERLHETVRLDTKCCGGVYELLVANMQQGNAVKRRGYNKVDSDVVSDEEGDIGLVSSHTIGGGRSPDMVRNVLVQGVRRTNCNDSDAGSRGEFL